MENVKKRNGLCGQNKNQIKFVLKITRNPFTRKHNITNCLLFTTIVFFSVMMGSMNLGMASPYIEAFGIAKGACAKVFNLIEKEPTINQIKAIGSTLNQPLTVLEFKDVDFHYPTRERMKVLDKLNLKIKRGQTVALVAPSGCGKSTCVQLIQRFYDPQGGAIHFNDVNLKDININWLRERIGVVGQEPILFGTTIYENIRYGREDATREEIEAAARAANALMFINKLPRGLFTMVGERGAQLSGGDEEQIKFPRRNDDEDGTEAKENKKTMTY